MRIRRMLVIIIVVLAVWIFLAQFVMLKNRISDDDVQPLFKSHQTALVIGDTIVDGRHIHFGVTGPDTLPTLIFIHGSPGSWTNYRAYMWDPVLRSKYRMISIDRPGFGYSDYGKALHLVEQAKLLLPVIRSFSNGRPITVLGHSMGAPVAVQLAAMDTSLIDRLVLVGASIDVRLERPESWRKVMAAGPMPLLMPGALRPSNTELLYLKTDLVGLQQEFRNVKSAVNFFHGDKDSWVPIENVAFGKSAFVNAREIRIDTLRGAGHLIPWQNQEEFLRYLRGIE